MKIYKVSYKWYDTETWCVNMAVAESEEGIIKYYSGKGHKRIIVAEAKDWEVENAKRKGIPTINVENDDEI